jgi:hypothetical protein
MIPEKFIDAGDQVINRMNESGKKIDTLESNLRDIISHLPAEESNTASASSQATTGTTNQQTKS